MEAIWLHNRLSKISHFVLMTPSLHQLTQSPEPNVFRDAVVDRQVHVFDISHGAKVELIEASLLVVCYKAVLEVVNVRALQIYWRDVEVCHFAAEAFGVDGVVSDVNHSDVWHHLNSFCWFSVHSSFTMQIVADNPQLVVEWNVVQLHWCSVSRDRLDDDQLRD